MTLQELQEKLGEQVDLITDKMTPYEAKKRIAEIAMTVSSLAKQMINNADVVLRAEKLVAEGKLKQSSIIKMINNGQKTN
jgi:hypothetical protein